MGYASKREPRRRRQPDPQRARVPCAACGAPTRPPAPDLPFCNHCLDAARHRSFARSDAHDTRD